MQYFLGLDAGGSKTRAVIIDENSQIKGEAIGGPANYHNIGLSQVAKNVYRTIAEVLSKSYLKESDVTWTAIGIASCDSPKDHEALHKIFTSDQMAFLSKRLTLVNDTKIGLYCGTTPPGIVTVAGTGCNVYGVNSHGEEAFAGNWGHFLGDRGSGYQLGKWMFQTVVGAYDGIEVPTLLTQKLASRIDVASAADIQDWYVETNPSIHEISDFAPLVIEAAEEGDETAKSILDKTVAELGRALRAVVVRLKMENEYNRIVVIGGLFESKYFRALFEGHVTALITRVRIVKPLVSAAVGAAIMAKEERKKGAPIHSSSSSV